MRRRELVALIGGAASMWPLGVRARQSDRMRRIAVLASGGREDEAHVAAFRERLDNLDWHEARDIQIEVRLAKRGIDRARSYAAELVAKIFR